jgi:hypothetical protein
VTPAGRPAAPAKTETMFTVTMTSQPTAWGEAITLRLVNPDGTAITEHTWQCGPDGFVGADETDMAAWAGEQAQDFMETFFAAAWEQNNQHLWNAP